LIGAGIFFLGRLSSSQPAPQGPPAFSLSQGPMGLLGGGTGYVFDYTYASSYETATPEELVQPIQCYLDRLGNPDLAVARLREFQWAYQAEIFERSTGRHAFGLMMGKGSFQLSPKAGPNIFWITQYGSLIAALGELAKDNKRNKVTFLVPEALSPLGMWLEQLLAESTGKEGTGLLPVASEPLGEPTVYGQDRIFVYIRMKDAADDVMERGLSSLREAGQPVITIYVDDLLDLGQEFFRWEIATATAGAILGINAFNQPNVQESKDNTNRLLATVRDRGKLPGEKPSLIKDPLKLYFDEKATTVPETLKRFLAQSGPGDYLSLMAYITEDIATQQALQDIRLLLRDHLHIATTLGYGPRFLHSTGQFHKGGPNTGWFLQLTADDVEDVPIPGAPYTFGVFKRAQALGDLEALQKHGRRVGRVHLGSDINRGLAVLKEGLKSALQSEQAMP
jgi:hypothetical protein